jgi:hypothetical protein
MWFSYIRLDDNFLERVRFFGLQRDRAPVFAITGVALVRERTLLGVKLRMVIEWPGGRLSLPLDQFRGQHQFPSMRNVDLVPLVVELERLGVPIEAELKAELGIAQR